VAVQRRLAIGLWRINTGRTTPEKLCLKQENELKKRLLERHKPGSRAWVRSLNPKLDGARLLALPWLCSVTWHREHSCADGRLEL
jgi:hypothetical protein